MFLNTIVADSIHHLADQIEKELKNGLKREIAIHKVVTETLKEHQRVVFNGNGYSEEWVQEAKQRGLFNLRTYPEAIAQLTSEKNIKLFTTTGVLSKKELESQQHIAYENYAKVIGVESGVMLQMINGSIIPAVFEYKKNLSGAITSDNQFQTKYFNDIDSNLTKLLQCADELKAARTHAATQFDDHHLHDQAQYYRQQVVTAMENARTVADTLELMVDDKLWPFPKYPEMLFLK
jgi:glutamine synthetase